MDKDEVLVKLVEHESVIWKRNHTYFKNVQMKEQAWHRVAYQLGISTTEAERRFKSIREKYRRRKILLERDVSNNVEHSKLKRWDLYSKLGFLDDYMIPRNSGIEGMMLSKSESVSSENITSTNNNECKDQSLLDSVPSILNTALLNLNSTQPQKFGNIIIRPVMQVNHQAVPSQSNRRLTMSAHSPTTTTANISDNTIDNEQFLDVKMEVPDDDDDDDNENNDQSQYQMEPKTGNFNYVGEFIAAELNKLPLRNAFILKNILIREVLNYSDKVLESV
ncbi:unnamed protein product [Diamesa tonsa]